MTSKESLTTKLAPHIGEGVTVIWLEPDAKTGCVRFGLSDGRVGDMRPGGESKSWSEATVYVGGS